MIDNYTALTETFQLLTRNDKTKSYTETLRYCETLTTEPLAQKLKKDVMQVFNATVDNMLNTYTTNENGRRTLLNQWQATTPCDIYGAFLERIQTDTTPRVEQITTSENLETHIVQPKITDIAPNKPDFCTLEQYLNANFELYPCVTNQNGAYIPIRQDGQYKLYGNDGNKHGIKDKQTLKDLCNGKPIIDAYGNPRIVTVFKVYPSDNNFVVIDIDNHEGKKYGFAQWSEYIAKKHAPQYTDVFKHPCYVVSPNGGIHLYFKCYSLPERIKHNLASEIEIKAQKNGINAGGSFKNGKHYVLHGSFDQAPILPYFILQHNPTTNETLPSAQQRYHAPSNAPKFTGHYWYETAQGIIDKAKETHGTAENHDFINHCCVLFKNANIKNGMRYTKSEVENAIFATPQHLNRKDKNDTQSCINSYSKYFY